MTMQAASLQAQPDELIDFSHLKSNRGLSQLELEDEVATDLKRATGLAATSAKGTHHLNRVLQLTGQIPFLDYLASRLTSFVSISAAATFL